MNVYIGTMIEFTLILQLHLLLGIWCTIIVVNFCVHMYVVYGFMRKVNGTWGRLIYSRKPTDPAFVTDKDTQTP